MKQAFLFAFSFFIVVISYAQTNDTTVIGNMTVVTYSDRSPADSLRDIGDLKGAIECYKEMFERGEADFFDIYYYACALSVDSQLDSAFKYLEIAMEQDTFAHVFTDPDFLNLRDDKRWADFESKWIALIQKKSGNPIIDIEYAKQLWYMEATDQAYYDCIDLAERETGQDSPVVRALWKLKDLLNKKNQQDLEKLIESKGWPKISDVGESAADAAFLVIQHSDPDKRQKYLPVIENLCKENEASWQSYALMYDRIQTDSNKPQKYGTQVRFNEEKNAYELFPLLDENKVDQWREEMGLEPLADYLSYWGIEFFPVGK